MLTLCSLTQWQGRDINVIMRSSEGAGGGYWFGLPPGLRLLVSEEKTLSKFHLVNLMGYKNRTVSLGSYQ